jgi:hypothetical protein
MKYIAFIFCILNLSYASAKTDTLPLSLFQTQIKDCALGLNDLQSIKSFSALYAELQKQYLITSERILYREIYFQAKGEKRKIKITNEVVEIFRIDKDAKPTKLGIDRVIKIKQLKGL